MRQFTLSFAVACALLPLASGCGKNSQIVRGQAPADANCPPCAIARCGGYSGCADPYAPPGYVRGPNYRYLEPNNLSYPNQNVAPALVQYPYYTVKGPDCFFHK